jgi:5-hydroxyisourate hydrolase
MITTHVLDLSSGRPATGVRVTLTRSGDTARTTVGAGITDADGRLRDLVQGDSLRPGVYELQFETGAYFRAQGIATFHPWVTVTFEVSDSAQHYHVPVLISPFGYTTYRGS